MEPWNDFAELLQLHMMHGRGQEEACQIAWHQATGNAGLITTNELTNVLVSVRLAMNSDQFQLNEALDSAFEAILHAFDTQAPWESLQ